jgi:hypothetical protein
VTDSQKNAYLIALKSARSSFDLAARALVEAEIEARKRKQEMSLLRRTITALAAQCSEEPWADPLGITETCSEVMETVPYEMSTQDVVKRLEEMGFDTASQKNAAASVHTVLSRLAEKGKIQKITNDDGKAAGWRGQNYDPKFFDISDEDIPF